MDDRYASLPGAATSIVFVATKTCLLRQNTFLSRQNTSFAATDICFSGPVFLSRQNSFCSDRYVLSRQNVCRDKTFVAANIILSRQAYFLSRQTRVCRDKRFVATKMILLAAPANDSYVLGFYTRPEISPESNSDETINRGLPCVYACKKIIYAR